MVEDGSVDFAFSFDSLVHAEADVLGAYLGELARKLKPDGVGFIHHSNIGGYPRQTRLARRVPEPRCTARWSRRGVLDQHPRLAGRERHRRAVRRAVPRRRGSPASRQEKINWEYGRHLIDAFSMFTPRGLALGAAARRWSQPALHRRGGRGAGGCTPAR